MGKFRKILLILLFLSLAGLAMFVLLKRRGETPTVALPTPKIPRLLPGELNIQIEFSEKDFNFPKELPVLEKKAQAFTPEGVKKIAESLGFTSTPIVAKDATEGVTHIFQNEGFFLVAYLEKGRLEYQLASLPETINKQITDTGLVNIAKGFLVKNGLASEEEIRFSSLLPLKKTSTSQGFTRAEKSQASLYQINFSPKVLSFPLLTLNAQNSPIYVRVLPDGSVFSINVTRLKGASLGETKYKLKNFKEVVASINNAILVSLDYGNVPVQDLEVGSIGKASVKKVELAYLFDSPDSNVLQPVYFFEGEVEIAEKPEKINAAFYLPALVTP